MTTGWKATDSRWWLLQVLLSVVVASVPPVLEVLPVPPGPGNRDADSPTLDVIVPLVRRRAGLEPESPPP